MKEAEILNERVNLFLEKVKKDFKKERFYLAAFYLEQYLQLKN